MDAASSVDEAGSVSSSSPTTELREEQTEEAVPGNTQNNANEEKPASVTPEGATEPEGQNQQDAPVQESTTEQTNSVKENGDASSGRKRKELPASPKNEKRVEPRKKRRETPAPAVPSEGRMVTRSRSKAANAEKERKIVKTSRHWSLKNDKTPKKRKKGKWDEDEEEELEIEEEDENELQIEEEDEDEENKQESEDGEYREGAREAEALLLCNFESTMKTATKKQPARAAKQKKKTDAQPKPKPAAKAKGGEKRATPASKKAKKNNGTEAGEEPAANGDQTENKNKKQPAKNGATTRGKKKPNQTSEDEENAKSLGLLAAAVFFQEGEDMEEDDLADSKEEAGEEEKDAAALAAEEEKEEKRREKLKRKAEEIKKLRRNWIAIDKIRGDEELRAAFVEKTRKFIQEMDLEIGKKKERLKKPRTEQEEKLSNQAQSNGATTEPKVADVFVPSENKPSEEGSVPATSTNNETTDQRVDEQNQSNSEAKDDNAQNADPSKSTAQEISVDKPVKPEETTPMEEDAKEEKAVAYDRAVNEKKLQDVMELMLFEFKKTFQHTLTPQLPPRGGLPQQSIPIPMPKTTGPALFFDKPLISGQPISPQSPRGMMAPQQTAAGQSLVSNLQPLQPRPPGGSPVPRILPNTAAPPIAQQQQLQQALQQQQVRNQIGGQRPAASPQQQPQQQPIQFRQGVPAMGIIPMPQQVLLNQTLPSAPLPLPTIQPLTPPMTPQKGGTPTNTAELQQPNLQENKASPRVAPKPLLASSATKPFTTTPTPAPAAPTAPAGIMAPQLASVAASPVSSPATRGILPRPAMTGVVPMPQIIPNPTVAYPYTMKASPSTLPNQPQPAQARAPMLAPPQQPQPQQQPQQPAMSAMHPSSGMTTDNSQQQMVKKDFTFHLQGAATPHQASAYQQTAMAPPPTQYVFQTSYTMPATAHNNTNNNHNNNSPSILAGPSAPYVHTNTAHSGMTANNTNSNNGNNSNNNLLSQLDSSGEYNKGQHPSFKKEEGGGGGEVFDSSSHMVVDDNSIESETVEESGEVGGTVEGVLGDSISNDAKSAQDDAVSLFNFYMNEEEISDVLSSGRVFSPSTDYNATPSPTMQQTQQPTTITTQPTGMAYSNQPLPNIAAIQPNSVSAPSASPITTTHIIGQSPLPVIHPLQEQGQIQQQQDKQSQNNLGT